ncbi:hypothetical protein HETIRDRAFT_316320 [Heterobasidion irregulare TC 32-1]|uniref:Uncharacterized protein n=1 Tax=Heterobasidion irregulare (strain TC 32-1) TaxID=747525 RepID=W4K9F8_HETIT|nr:uncharacterized protein HETIRDRAFT_316320 [Heterobasidion irregulare TC 32-1]ETW82369.1 hypothetical protein HETIRDRAFT_316320 [Heterobasidion irregulare TC 32-1]
MEKSDVWRLQTASHTWKCDPILQNVSAMSCEKVLSITQDVKGPVICAPCMQIDFKNALRHPEPPSEKMKYLNTRYCDEITAMAYARVVGLHDVLNKV